MIFTRTSAHATKRIQAYGTLLLLIAILLIVLLASLFVGIVSLSPMQILFALVGSADPMANAIIGELRLPRVLGAAACGALLALAGAMLQVLLRNPLADPYVLGVSGGAAVGALLPMMSGATLIFINGGAFAGALISILLVFGLARANFGQVHTRLLLTGTAVASGCGAIVALLLTIAPSEKLHGMLFWLMGDASRISDARLPLVAVALLTVTVLPLARDWNVLAHGPHLAQSLGVRVARIEIIGFVLASAATAIAVTSVGSVGFVGLIVPHLTRLAIGNDQRLLLPASSIVGAILLVIADTLARSIWAPHEIPVGVLTALIGIPIFLFLLRREAAPSS